MTAGEENMAAEQEPLDPFLAAVKELGRKSISLVEGQRLFLEILADAEKTMDADAYRTFKEMAEDLFARERRKYTTGRK
jgi:hypothetical protein